MAGDVMRCMRLFTGPDGRSHVDQAALPLDVAQPAASARLVESPPGSALDWHVAAHRQLVVTLAGTIEFVTRDGESFTLRPGDLLLAEDTVGAGHRWRLVDDEPWRRLYVVLGEG